MDDNTFLNQLAEKLSKLGTVRPLGFHYLHPYETVPADSIICNGATYSRALYKDFFDYITAQGWVKTEAEWQEIVTRDNGFCPFYSDGDGSTNFRTPKFAPYQQIAMEIAKATAYHQAGIPNVEGDTGINVGSIPSSTPSSGAFYHKTTTIEHLVGSSYNIKPAILFDASRNSKVYGASDTVTPESHSWVMCVVAYGIATNVGSVDIQNVMSAVNAVQAKVDSKLEAGTVHITETWKSTESSSWYRKWSDGWIEQGGTLQPSSTSFESFSFPVEMKDTNFLIVGNHIGTTNSTYAVTFTKLTTTSAETKSGVSGYAIKWYVCGY